MEAPSFTLEELARLTGSRRVGDGQAVIHSANELPTATEGDLSFLANPKYAPHLSTTKATAVCVPEETPLEAGKNYLISSDPSRTFQIAVEAFLKNRKESGFTGIHPTAVIHETASIEEDVSIGPYAVIDAHAKIGPRTRIDAHAHVGLATLVGPDCHLYPHAVVREHCELKARVILQPGVVIGSCGFGYTHAVDGTHTKLKQLGNVILEDDVEIGANTTIDRARFKTTRIGEGSKIDNLVQVAHNVEIGPNNIIAAQTGLAGSCKTGRSVMMGGQVGVVGHLEITDFVMIGAKGGISKSIKTPGRYAGSPVTPVGAHNKAQVHTRKLDQYVRRIAALEKQLEALTAASPCE